MPAQQDFCLQNIKISFEYADFHAKISIIMDNAARNGHQYSIVISSVVTEVEFHSKAYEIQ